MYLGSWKVDDVLTFPANTHAASTGAATDADSVPAYRVYEDETATPILTGSMALLDSANTVGLYSEAITLSAANGFEKGKCYTIYISAAVSSVTGTMSHTFQVEAEVDLTVTGAAAAAVATRIEMDSNSTQLAAIVADTNELQTDWTNGGRLDLLIDAILLDTGTTLDGKLDAIDNFLDTEIAAILQDTGTTLPATLATIDGKLDTIDGNVDAILVDTGTTLPASIATIDGNVDAILVDTGTTLPATLTTIDNFLDTEVAAIKAVTDALTFTVAGNLDCNVKYVNDVPVTGVGSTADPWGP